MTNAVTQAVCRKSLLKAFQFCSGRFLIIRSIFPLKSEPVTSVIHKNETKSYYFGKSTGSGLRNGVLGNWPDAAPTKKNGKQLRGSYFPGCVVEVKQ
jgi:hypothetical protein